jgi:hypothetical protein
MFNGSQPGVGDLCYTRFMPNRLHRYNGAGFLGIARSRGRWDVSQSLPEN